ncbi:hypothetical protein GCM10010170_098370 [Dactylosporangium salmoneum]|uniref:Uncharacterized protein n=1 Tax=Dactylosporangium salmoneum TaxID=53361 RepID=A0ABN3HT12_9ACTN
MVIQVDGRDVLRVEVPEDAGAAGRAAVRRPRLGRTPLVGFWLRPEADALAE